MQILRAHGCRVAGVDLNPARCDLARALGADLAVSPADAPSRHRRWTRELGADLVLVAAASAGSEPAVLAAELSRDKGRIVAVGATGLDLPRRTLYEKELSVVVSRSYGPGRYDPNTRSTAATIRCRTCAGPSARTCARSSIWWPTAAWTFGPLISHRFPIADAERAYEALERQSVLGIVLEYPQTRARQRRRRRCAMLASRQLRPRPQDGGRAGVSFIGTGNFARGVLLPAFARRRASSFAARLPPPGFPRARPPTSSSFAYCSTDASDVWNDEDCNARRHRDASRCACPLVIEALEAGKAVFVEKPLCLTEIELDEIVATVERPGAAGATPLLMVGFNRRFAPATSSSRQHFAKAAGSISIIYRVNAGRVPHGSWVADRRAGRRPHPGRSLSLRGPVRFSPGRPSRRSTRCGRVGDADEVMVTLRMANGTIATIAYVVGGDPAGPKERIEVFGGGATGVSTTSAGHDQRPADDRQSFGGRFARQDKGHTTEVRAFVNAVRRGGASPVPFASAVNSTRATFAILSSLESRCSNQGCCRRHVGH